MPFDSPREPRRGRAQPPEPDVRCERGCLHGHRLRRPARSDNRLSLRRHSNQGIHIDFANSLRLVPAGAEGNLLGGIGTGIARVVGLITGTQLETGPTPIPNAALYFMPTPDGQVSADRNPGSRCRSTNASVHMAYNASPNWMYLSVDPPVQLPAVGRVLGCTVRTGAIPPGTIQHLFLGANFSYNLSPTAPRTSKATPKVRAACRQDVSRSASRGTKTRARKQATNCEKALMYAKDRKAAMRRR